MTSKRQHGPIYAFAVEARPGIDGIRSLRQALKLLGRYYHLRCVYCQEVEIPKLERTRDKRDAV
jgi:hypothetical protein